MAILAEKENKADILLTVIWQIVLSMFLSSHHHHQDLEVTKELGAVPICPILLYFEQVYNKLYHYCFLLILMLIDTECRRLFLGIKNISPK